MKHNILMLFMTLFIFSLVGLFSACTSVGQKFVNAQADAIVEINKAYRTALCATVLPGEIREEMELGFTSPYGAVELVINDVQGSYKPDASKTANDDFIYVGSIKVTKNVTGIDLDTIFREKGTVIRRPDNWREVLREAGYIVDTEPEDGG